ncbi:CPBP family intramembrane metalloprotease, partial [Enterococcus faecalis]|nr:CPBP family intramembrane metalloprotease [Enterococcus faecalis]
QGHTTTANDSTLIKLFSGVSPVLVVLLLGIAAPIMEEIVFRGGIIGYLVENNALLAILISSFLFGIIHGPTNFISFGMYFFMGIILSVSYYKTKDLRVSISIHFLNNLFPAIAIAYGLI